MRGSVVVLLLSLACSSDPRRTQPPSSRTERSAVRAVPPSAGPRAPALPPSAPGAPDLAGLRALLAPHAALRFDAAAQERGCPADQTLGEYVALLADNAAAPGSAGDVRQFGASCVASIAPADRIPIDPPADPAYWACRIDSYVSDAAGESPWHYELRLRVGRDDGAVDLATLACPGAS